MECFLQLFISEALAIHPEVNEYTRVADKGVVLTDNIVFRVKSCAEPRINLRTQEQWVCTVIIGKHGGLETLICFELTPRTCIYAYHNVTQTDCNAFRDYWIKWNYSVIEVGNGLEAVMNKFMVASVNNSWATMTDANVGSNVATVDWIISKQVICFEFVIPKKIRI